MILFQIDGRTIAQTRATRQETIARRMDELALQHPGATITVVYPSVHTARPHLAGPSRYIAICTCGWSDLPRTTWTNAMRDVTYHLHTAGLHPYACHYCQDEALGIPVSETSR